MMADLIYNLRAIGCFANGDAPCTCITGHDAADAIERLEAENARLRELLADAIKDETEFETEWNKAARAALHTSKADGGSGG
jgi:formylglycine-generating enzyme required for sulfatase activity